MNYLWTEDTGAGLHFWNLVNQIFFDDKLIVESKKRIQIRKEILSVIENHKINLEKIKDGKTLKYLTGFKKYSTERVMKSLAGELTENEKWSIRGTLLGECWYQDCCVSEHPNSLRCGIPETKKGNERIKLLIQSEEVQKVLLKIVN